MKIYFILPFFLFSSVLLLFLTCTNTETPCHLSGKYTAISNFRSSQWPELRYYEKLSFSEKCSCFLNLFPIIVNGSETLSSASDGGFFYYKGKYEESNDTIVAKLKVYMVDYAIVKDSFKTLTIVKKKDQIYDVLNDLEFNKIADTNNAGYW